MKKKAVVLLSGGIDSTTCIDRAKAFQANGISDPALNNN